MVVSIITRVCGPGMESLVRMHHMLFSHHEDYIAFFKMKFYIQYKSLLQVLAVLERTRVEEGDDVW